MQLPPEMQHHHSPPPDFSLPIAVGAYQYEVGMNPQDHSTMAYNEEQSLYYQDDSNVAINHTQDNYNSMNQNENIMNAYMNDHQMQYIQIPAETYYYQQMIPPYDMSNGAPINGYVNMQYGEQYDMYNNNAPMVYSNEDNCYHQSLQQPGFMPSIQQVLVPTIVSDHVPVVSSEIHEVESSCNSFSEVESKPSNNPNAPDNFSIEQPKNEKSKALLNLLRTPQKNSPIENSISNPVTPLAASVKLINSPLITAPTPTIINLTNSPIVSIPAPTIPMQSVIMPQIMPSFVGGTYNLATGVTPYYSPGPNEFDGYGYDKNVRHDNHRPEQGGAHAESAGKPMKSNITVIKPNVENKKRLNYRVTRNQPATLELSFFNQKGQKIVVQQPGVGIRPIVEIMVSWSLLKKDFQHYNELHVGLAGYGLAKCMTSKAVNQEKSADSKYYEEYTDLFGNLMVKGVVMFRAPTKGGRFVFRMYNNIKDDSLITLGTSLSFIVELVDAEITSNLQFVIDKFIKHDDAAIIQMISVIKTMRNLGKPWQGQTPETLIRDCIQFIQTKINLSYEDVDMGDDARSLTPPLESDRVKNTKIHTEIFHLFKSMQASATAWSLLSENQREYITDTIRGYCNITNRFYPSVKVKNESLIRKFGFLPIAHSREKPSQAKRKVYNSLDRVLDNLLVKLIPPTDSAVIRDSVRQRVENILLSSDLGITNKVLMYGSSVNCFGMNESDIDLCFESPSLGWDKFADDRCSFLVDVARVLSDNGMYNIFVRPTAPVPFIEFVDPESGSEVDLSLNHPLAIHNSKLLSTYAGADPRVRKLVYVIRYWAKRRGINSTYDGTLSSYALMILVIHFLQHRPVPLLPNLKKLSSDWDGKNNNDNDVYIEDQEYIVNPIDKSVYDAYFYTPNTANDINALKKFASNNKETVGELLVGFFLYFAHEYNYVESVVSISSHLQDQQKIDRVEKFGWQSHDRLSIEDPIEAGFDISHGIKSPQFYFIRKELLRAYSLISQAFDPKNISSDEKMNDMQRLVETICIDDNLPLETAEETIQRAYVGYEGY